MRLIDGRSAAFRAAVAAAPRLDVQVPNCPEWTLFALVQHLGDGRRAWAATVAASPDAMAKSVPPQGAPAAPPGARGPAGLAGGIAAGTAGRQLQEIALHTCYAQITVGGPQPLPVEVTLDGVEEFLSTCNATTSARPHKPTVFEYHATEGCSWRLTVDGDGARPTRIPEPAGQELGVAGASLRGTAGELVLTLYGRIPPDSLELGGDRSVFDQLIAREPEA
ncbi:maleylpyruvate isomerase N-terminal domain-containing protein [Streptomyces sp. WM6372]|uniref:maleylpyruvate isomerase N-terminal domain-containing protein n=1 Tax=Streptomyces sp. WM6372 TaxID=1415555 RepID=UPI001F2D0543|nr:maleylpyruvate isomerase N-terminal domain-containing protein [Streptomyces sp. WM6372]